MRIGGIFHKRAPLAGHGPCQRFVEFALRQDHAAGSAVALLPSFVLGDERDNHRKPGPGMRGQIAVGFSFRRARRGPWQR